MISCVAWWARFLTRSAGTNSMPKRASPWNPIRWIIWQFIAEWHDGIWLLTAAPQPLCPALSWQFLLKVRFRDQVQPHATPTLRLRLQEPIRDSLVKRVPRPITPLWGTPNNSNSCRCCSCHRLVEALAIMATSGEPQAPHWPNQRRSGHCDTRKNFVILAGEGLDSCRLKDRDRERASKKTHPSFWRPTSWMNEIWISSLVIPQSSCFIFLKTLRKGGFWMMRWNSKHYPV